MLFGLTFSTTGGESLQFAFDTAGLNLYARATHGGFFGDWKFICGADDAEGDSSETTEDKAETANKAYRLASPITIQFTGGVSGEVTFDGSQNVSTELALTGGGGGTSEDRVRELARDVIQQELGDGRPPYKLIEKALKDAFREHQLEWHNGIQ